MAHPHPGMLGFRDLRSVLRLKLRVSLSGQETQCTKDSSPKK